MYRRARNFLTKTDTFLDNWVTQQGYDTCHATEGYDVEPCYQDCLQLENSQFAKQCSRDGGLFKCCIRKVQNLCGKNRVNIFPNANIQLNLIHLNIQLVALYKSKSKLV